LKQICHRIALVAAVVALAGAAAMAADAENGRRVAESRCVACHIVTTGGTLDLVADAPPFEAIARKFNFDPDMLAFHLREPHPKMNFALTQREANDVAAYMSTLPH
jgi:mono/diheme cytochrome c family protein